MHTDPPEGFPAVLEAGRVFDLLLSLVDKSLVLYDEDDAGRGRYRLLETMRQYAATVPARPATVTPRERVTSNPCSGWW